MASGHSTKEAEAFRKHSDLLLMQIQPPDIIPLGIQLFAKNIITTYVKEVLDTIVLEKATRVSKLVDAIISYLQCSPENFQKVLDVFRSDMVYEELVDQIEKTYQEMGEYNILTYKVYKYIILIWFYLID